MPTHGRTSIDGPVEDVTLERVCIAPKSHPTTLSSDSQNPLNRSQNRVQTSRSPPKTRTPRVFLENKIGSRAGGSLRAASGKIGAADSVTDRVLRLG